MRRILLLTVLILATVFGFGQRKSAIGFSFNLTDFQTPTDISNSSLSHVLNGSSWSKISNFEPGFSITYWKGITKKIDASLRYNGLFGSNTFKTLSNKSGVLDYFNELELSAHARALKDNVAVNPFLSVGIGVGNYWEKFGIAPYAPLGVGLQFNIANEAYVHLQANYRLSFDKDKSPSNLFYSLGIAQSLATPKPKVIPPPPVPVNIDKDADGVVDSLDACPNDAGSVALQGCPDTDGDGIVNKDDKCADVAGIAKYNGCPIPDTDNDGVNDDEDKCVQIPGVARYQGCPIPDSDNDGINDEEDKCPNLAGVKENQGCPEIKEEIKKKIEKASHSIYFASGNSKLLAKSNKGLSEVAAILAENPEMRLAIDGHTDNTGKVDKNQILSDNRSAAVKQYLVSKGVDESRLTATGHGQDQPIGDNKTITGRSKNRRVELKLSYFVIE